MSIDGPRDFTAYPVLQAVDGRKSARFLKDSDINHGSGVQEQLWGMSYSKKLLQSFISGALGVQTGVRNFNFDALSTELTGSCHFIHSRGKLDKGPNQFHLMRLVYKRQGRSANTISHIPHHDGAVDTGRAWMSKLVSFDRVKVTNNQQENERFFNRASFSGNCIWKRMTGPSISDM
ncbi:hypothetical protein OSTOST_01822 [Ostertagia ostertagi]